MGTREWIDLGAKMNLANVAFGGIVLLILIILFVEVYFGPFPLE